MAKPGSNKKRCEKYKNSGHREENKRLRQVRDKKQKTKFAKRKEDGKSYEYKPIQYKEGTADYNKEIVIRKEKNMSKKTEYQRLRSIFQKLENELEKERKAAKAAEENNGGKNASGNNS